MSKQSITFRSILMSKLEDDNGQYAYNVDERTGMLMDYNSLVDGTIDLFFSEIRLPKVIELHDDFKRAFAFEFKDKEVEGETYAQFRDKLQVTLSTDCFNLLKFYNDIRDKDLEELINSMDINNTSEGNQEGSSLGIVASQPEEKLSILYEQTGQDKTITLADALQESHNRGKGTNKSNTSGYSGMPLFMLLNRFARIPSIERDIFYIVNKRCFSKRW